MIVQREWIDWHKPLLAEAAQWLLQRAAQPESVCDLQHVVVVLPNRRAGRILLAMLLEQCRARNLAMIPPEVLTPGPLVDRILGLEAEPIAMSIEVCCAWMKALKRIHAERLRGLMPEPPPRGDLLAWHDVAATLARLHAELAGARLGFADVAQQADALGMHAEADRWRVLAQLHEHYLRALKFAKLKDPHAMREQHIEQARQSRAAGTELVLIGVTELNALQRAAIAAGFPGNVTALVHAPPPSELHHSFDEYGCIKADAWKDRRIDIDDRRIHLADRPGDQAQRVLRVIASFEGRFTAEQITLGLGDPDLEPVLERNARWAGLTVKPPTGRKLQHSAPSKLLAVVADWLEQPRFACFASLLRHPDIEAWLNSNARSKVENPKYESDWLTLLDEYFAEHLQERLTGRWLGDAAKQRRMKAVYRAVHRLLAPLCAAASPIGEEVQPCRKPLGEWGQSILDVLASVYDINSADSQGAQRGENAIEVCAALRDILGEFAAMPETLQPKTDACTAIRLLLACSGGTSMAQQLQPGEIEMLGWLDLHLDPAPATIITGFNDGLIPEAVSLDPFLPDSLRIKLNLPNNQTRYARDAYFLEAIRHSRPEVAIVLGRRGADGDPLTPSRLLLACDDRALVKRVRAMCGEDDTAAPPAPQPPVGIPPAGAASRFRIPELPRELLIAPTCLSVTDFKIYLQCPFRFALSKLLKLEPLSDEAKELDPLQFGILAHDVLCAFGEDIKVADSADEQCIANDLIAKLHELAPQRYGNRPMLAVRVQIARLEQRLRSFAKFQAAHRARGWRIQHCEFSLKTAAPPLDIPGQEHMPVHGKIDRIDYNESENAWLIFDYKTGEAGESPHKTHHGCEQLADDGELEWVDLQLPLYHHLATRANLGMDPEHVKLGYICLPKQSDGVRARYAEWSGTQLESAINLAREIVRKIRAGEFEMNRELANSYDPFARICQTQVFAAEEVEAVE